MRRMTLLQVQKYRERAGLTKTELADRAGITPRTLRNIEQGIHKPNLATVVKIAEALGVTLNDMTSEPDATPV